MLSGESAQGLFPVLAVQTMATIDKKAELLFDYERAINYYFKQAKIPSSDKNVVLKIANKLKPTGPIENQKFPYDFCVIFSNDKKLINNLSCARPGATILVIASDNKILTSFGINYGIQTYRVDDLKSAIKNCKIIAGKAIERFSKQAKKAIIFANNKFISL
jgi:pyruvate kinase